MSDWKTLARNPAEWQDLHYDDPRLDAFATEVEKRNGLPPGMLVALKNAGERTNPGMVSEKKARGIMQFIDDTRAKYQHDPNDPFQSINAAGVYLKDLIKENTQRWYNVHGKNTQPNMARIYKAAMANYNGGPSQAERVLKNEKPTFEETANYVDRILKYLEKNYTSKQGAEVGGEVDEGSMDKEIRGAVEQPTKVAMGISAQTEVGLRKAGVHPSQLDKEEQPAQPTQPKYDDTVESQMETIEREMGSEAAKNRERNN